MGTIQKCPNCGQKIFVPEDDVQSLQEYVPPTTGKPIQTAHKPDAIYGYPAARSMERGSQVHKSRKVKMSAGCTGMLAVMFGIFILGFGYNLISELSEGAVGFFIILAGLGGLAAFVYFGYWATESEDRFEDRSRH